MYTQKDITKNIYDSDVDYASLVEFVKRIRTKESEYKHRLRISIETDDGGKYFFRSASEAFDEADTDNITTLDKKRITGFSISYNDTFSISFWPTLSCSVKVQAGDVEGAAIESVANSCFRFRYEKPFLVRMAESKALLVVLSIIYGISPILVFPEWQLVVVVILWNFLMQGIITMATISYTKTNRIIMGNKKDSFFVRNKDSIYVGIITTILGAILGYVVGSLDKLSC